MTSEDIQFLYDNNNVVYNSDTQIVVFPNMLNVYFKRKALFFQQAHCDRGSLKIYVCVHILVCICLYVDR